MKKIIPNPGSRKAINVGCTCPVIDNYYGEGVLLSGERQFWYAENCPIYIPGGIRHDDKKRKSVKRS